MISITLFVKPVPRIAPTGYTHANKYKGKKISFFDSQSNVLTDLKVRILIELQKQNLLNSTYGSGIPLYANLLCTFVPAKLLKKINSLPPSYKFEEHITVPDCDNLAKLYLDAAKNLLFADDRQIIKLTIKKIYDFYNSITISCWSKDEQKETELMKKNKISSEGLDLIKKFEGLQLKPYKCPGDVLTIGYGHALVNNEKLEFENGITEDKAEQLLRNDVESILERFDNVIKVKLNQNEIDALVSFVYNIGISRFISSTLYKKLTEEKSKEEVANEFSKWVYAKGERLNGLEKRRKIETNLFLKKQNDINEKEK